MADDEKPREPDALAGADPARPEEQGAGAEETAGGKLIHADVFLSRLAERREERSLAEGVGGEAKVVDAILGALESLGFDPDIVAPAFVRMAREASHEASPEEDAIPDGATDEPPTLEDMAVEELFLSELHAGRRPSLDAYLRRHANQRGALLRLATRMDPSELAGFDEPSDAPEAITPDQEAAARAGQEEGTRRALREVAKRSGQRGRGDTQRVAEEQARYEVSHSSETAKQKPGGRKRARPAQPDEAGPEG
ncbi:MAG TPA: hypothetical protein VFQ25_14910 [Ktedonobacterales bacterium]|nr:hypothetical protein [Ktedonobacterales bacterium]